MTGQLICKRVASALIGGVRANPWAAAVLGWGTLGLANLFLRGLDTLQGGLWVGGTLSVYSEGVSFEPNVFNRAVQDGALKTELRWSEVSGIKRRFGLLTSIIELSHLQGTQAFRCFGDKRVVVEMDKAWRTATA